MDTGKQLKELRQLLDVSQAEMAAWLGLSRSTLAAYEIGRRNPKPETLSKFVQALLENGLTRRFDEIEQYKDSLDSDNSLSAEQLRNGYKLYEQWESELNQARELARKLVGDAEFRRIQLLATINLINNDQEAELQYYKETLDYNEVRILEIYRNLNDENQEKAYDYIYYLYDRQDKE